MVDPLPGLEACDDLVFLVDAVGRDDERDMAAHRLLRGVAEDPLGGGVPALDHSVESLADDGVVRGLDDGREQASGAQAAGSVLLQMPPCRDVPKDDHESREAASFILDGCGTVVDGSLAAVLADEDRMVRGPFDGLATQRPCRRILERLPGLRVDNPEHRVERLVQRVGVRPPGQGFGNGIDVGDATCIVGGDDGVSDAAQRHPHQLAALAGAQLRDAHGLADPDDQRARERVRDGADDCLDVDRAERAARLDEEVIAGKVAKDCDEDGRTITADPDGSGDGAEERHQRQRITDQRVEQPAQKHCRDEGRDRRRIGC